MILCFDAVTTLEQIQVSLPKESIKSPIGLLSSEGQRACSLFIVAVRMLIMFLSSLILRVNVVLCFFSSFSNCCPVVRPECDAEGSDIRDLMKGSDKEIL